MKEGWRAGGRDGEWGRDGEREGWRREGWRRRNRDRGMSGRKYGMKQLQEYYCRKGRFQELRRASDTVCMDTDAGIQMLFTPFAFSFIPGGTAAGWSLGQLQAGEGFQMPSPQVLAGVGKEETGQAWTGWCQQLLVTPLLNVRCPQGTVQMQRDMACFHPVTQQTYNGISCRTCSYRHLSQIFVNCLSILISNAHFFFKEILLAVSHAARGGGRGRYDF